jgi:hypothetical protein
MDLKTLQDEKTLLETKRQAAAQRRELLARELEATENQIIALSGALEMLDKLIQKETETEQGKGQSNGVLREGDLYLAE